MVNLGNELLGSEGETDVAFLNIRTKRRGNTLRFQEKLLESLEILGWPYLFPFWERRRPYWRTTASGHLLFLLPWHKRGSAAGSCKATGAVGEDGTGSSGTMYCSNIGTLSSLPEPKWGENLWHPWLLPTCITGPDRERQLENWEPALKDFQECGEQLEITLSLVHLCPSLGTYRQVSHRIGSGVRLTSVILWRSAWIKLSLAPRDQ